MNHSTLTGLEICCHGRSSAIKSFAKALIAMLFLIFAIQFNGNAQGRPSCNISGSLEAVASGSDLMVTVEIAHSTAHPKLSYEFKSNSANAIIKSKSPLQYNAAKNSATQQLVLSPGTTGSEFNLKLEVTTPSGTSACSKSVSVSSIVSGGTTTGGTSSSPGGASTHGNSSSGSSSSGNPSSSGSGSSAGNSGSSTGGASFHGTGSPSSSGGSSSKPGPK